MKAPICSLSGLMRTSIWLRKSVETEDVERCDYCQTCGDDRLELPLKPAIRRDACVRARAIAQHGLDPKLQSQEPHNGTTTRGIRLTIIRMAKRRLVERSPHRREIANGPHRSARDAQGHADGRRSHASCDRRRGQRRAHTTSAATAITARTHREFDEGVTSGTVPGKQVWLAIAKRLDSASHHATGAATTPNISAPRPTVGPGTGRPTSIFAAAAIIASSEIRCDVKGEKDGEPNRIDEVPVDRSDRYVRVAHRPEITEERPDKNRRKNKQPDDDVSHVEACHGEEQRAIGIGGRGRTAWPAIRSTEPRRR